MTKIKEVTRFLEQIAPLPLQESYDNSGLLVGDPDWDINAILLSLDCTEEVVQEAINKGCNLIISHHPIIFKGLKRLTNSDYVQRTVIKAIRNDIALYAIHTNLDNLDQGVNKRFADKLGLKNTKILDQKTGELTHLVTFAPEENVEKVLEAMHKAGAGNIGDYIKCSFRQSGKGRFQPLPEADPYIGSTGKLEEVNEVRIEVIFPTYLKANVVDALRSAHPYEEVAYYLTTLQNAYQEAGAGMIGELPEAVTGAQFLENLKIVFGLKTLRHSRIIDGKIKRVAVCGGSGSFLISKAIREKADAFVTADLKYHEYFDADNRILLADIGHYESEIATTELLQEKLSGKFTTFAVNLTEVITNPIFYT